MKILFYNHTGQVSGAERVLLMILTRLDRSRFDPAVIFPEQGPLLEMTTKLGVPAEALPDLDARFTWRVGLFLRYLRSFGQGIRKLRDKIRRLKPDLIHANSIRAGLVATAATTGLPTTVIWHLHDLLPSHPLSTGVRLCAFLCSCTRMIAVSGAVAKNFCGLIPGMAANIKRRTTGILNAVDAPRFQPSQTAGEQVRAELNLQDLRPVIGITWHLTVRK